MSQLHMQNLTTKHLAFNKIFDADTKSSTVLGFQLYSWRDLYIFSDYKLHCLSS